MPMHRNLSRRGLLKAAGGLGAAVLLGGCDQITQSETPRRILESAESLNIAVQRALGGKALAAEFGEGDLSASFRANGTTSPDGKEYKAAAAQGFADWRLQVGGLVDKPARFSMSDMRALPSRTQITRHDCVEGWSCIGKWTGTRLSALLSQVNPRPTARYVVFRCADTLPSEGLSPPVAYYESIDLYDALHEQTILAYDMNGRDLPIAHGAPLRLRVERALGYKHAKYVMAIDFVDSLDKIGGGKGSYWADHGYSWYAGI